MNGLTGQDSSRKHSQTSAPKSVVRKLTDQLRGGRLARKVLPWVASDDRPSPRVDGSPFIHGQLASQFLRNEPFVAGTGIVGGMVPPLAGFKLRELAGHESVSGYLVTGDTWKMLVSRFLKERSKILEIGCGCGELARTLVYHPHLSSYIGLDSSEPHLEWCRAAYVPRSPEKYEFHSVELRPGSAPQSSQPIRDEARLPADDASIDLVVARTQFGYLEESAARLLLAEVRRILALNGLFLASIPLSRAIDSMGEPGRAASRLDPDRFQAIAEGEGLQVYQRMGLLGDQELFLFSRAPRPAGFRRDAERIESPNADDKPGAEKSKAPSSEHSPEGLDPRVLTGEMIRINQVAAAANDVLPDVHVDDFIYWFCATHPHLSLEGGIHYYFRDGGISARKLMDLIAGFDDLDMNSVKLLEFASGYGCVSRHLKQRPRLELVCCDIHPQAIEFLSETLGVRSLTSAHHPRDFSPPEKFDVVFALSFFSHMPRTTFGPWLRALFHALHDPGYLVFTTLGLKACKDFGIEPRDIPADGLWFEARSEQHDLDQAEYGMTIATPEFVRAVVERETGATVHAYKHVGWWDNQDLWVIKRDS